MRKNQVNPGRELDALIAEKVMGHDIKLIKTTFVPGAACAIYSLEPYSTDIAAAWQVVESGIFIEFCIANGYCSLKKSIQKKIEQSIKTRNGTPINNQWDIEFRSSRKHSHITFLSGKLGLPHLICLAALKAVGVEV